MLRQFLLRLIASFQSRRSARDAAREIDAHRALIEDGFRASGLNGAEAKRQARLALGGVIQTQENHRDARMFAVVDDLQRDIRYALRSLRRTPGFTFIAVLTLALGIGANAAIFSVVYAVLVNPLPYQDPGRLVRIYRDVLEQDRQPGMPPRMDAVDARDFLVLQAQSKTLSHVASVAYTAITTTVNGSPVHFTGAPVSSTLAPMLDVQAVRGRWFSREEETPGRDKVIVLSYAAWQEYFAGDDRALGQSIVFTGRAAGPLGGTTPLAAYSVIGVMPREFQYPDAATQFWIPRAVVAPVNNRPRLVSTIARVADNVSLDAAAAEVNALLATAAHESARPVQRFELQPIAEEIGAPVRSGLLALLAAVGCVLLIACTNVASLVLARAESRAHEMAVRVALGAGRGRLLRQLLTESLVLSCTAGAGGAVLAATGVSAFKRLATSLPRRDLGADVAFPRLSAVNVDVHALAFAAAMAMATGVLVWLAPAFGSASGRRIAAGDASRYTPSGRAFTPRGALTVAEVALATALLVNSALLIESFVRLTGVHLGYEPSHVLTFQVGLPGDRRSTDALVAFADTLVERLRSVPGVDAAAYANQLPTVGLRDTAGGLYRTPDNARPPAPSGADARVVSRDYIRALGIRVTAGRAFNEGDTSGAPRVLLINQSLARTEFGMQSPLRQAVYIGRDVRPWTVIGIVDDVRQFGLDRDPEPQFFIDFRQAPQARVINAGDAVAFAGGVAVLPAGAYYVIRTRGDPAAMVRSVRGEISQLDRSASLDNVATLDAIVANALTRPRLYAFLPALLALLALTLAAVGVYGVTAYGVARRTREIGIRLALGARPPAVLGMVMKQSATLTIAGTLLGLAGAAATTRYLQSLLFGLTPLDARTFAGVALLLTVIAAVASYVPAGRATRISALEALRHD